MDERFALEGYVVDELIGFGGTGEVWRAHEVETGETVALKRLRIRSAAATERLRREAALLASVAGPHVIGVRRLVVEGDEAVLVMDHAVGGSLATVLGVRGRLPAPEVVTVLAPIAAALAAAHASELVHGDITPANILFTADGRPLLADFGVAQALGGSFPAGPPGVDATIDYLDPAVALGSPVTVASDVFALGAVGFSALTGQPVWGTGTAAEILSRASRASRGDRPALASLAPTAPPALVAVIEAMLSPEPDDRPDARSAANAVLRAGPAAPVGLVHTAAPSPPRMTHPVRPAVALTPPPASPSEPVAPPAGVVQSKSGGSTPPDAAAEPSWRRRLVVAAVAIAALSAAAALGVGWAHLGRTQANALAPAATASGSPRPSLSASPSPARSRSPSPAPRQSSPSSSRTTSSPGETAATGAEVTSPSQWLAIVAHLDAMRAEAFSHGDVALLGSVYVPGSTAYSADLTTVRSLASRGLRARGFSATVKTVSVESSTSTTARLRVVDRLSAYTLIGSGGTVAGHGAARPARAFTMSLTNVAGAWRVAAITPAR